jgi:nucleoside-diphosphate-sugar epimerase
MTSKRIFVTGASGCIGHYIVDQLIRHTDHELFLLVRNPEKLKFDTTLRSGVHILVGDVRSIEQYSTVLATIDTAILTATSWGDAEETYKINVTQTLELISFLDPQVCQQILYFSTASILDRNNQPLKQAGELGTDYIRTKYQCHEKLQDSDWKPKITTIYPTLVFGGDDRFPKSPVSTGLPDIIKWMSVARFLKTEGSFHFSHAYDIAQVVGHFVDHPPAVGDRRDIVTGHDRYSVQRLIEETCAYRKQPIYFQLDLKPWLIDFIIKVFKIQMADWDRFCITHRHFTHQNIVNPSHYGLTSYAPTAADLFRVSGIPAAK